MKKILSLLLYVLLVFAPGSPLLGQELFLKVAWELQPNDEHDFITTENAERGLAYNPETDHVLLVTRSPGPPTVRVLDAESGEYLGTLSTDGIEGGLFILNKIAVADDGTIYAGNLTLDSSMSADTPSPFRLYRWENEDAEPELVYVGDPSGDDTDSVNRRFGDSIALRGTGAETEILLSTWSGSVFSLLTPDEGDGFAATPVPFPSGVPAGAIKNLAFGPGDLFYGSTTGSSTYEMELNAASAEVSLSRTFSGAIIAAAMGPLAVSEEHDILAGIRTDSHSVYLYERDRLQTETVVPPLLTHNFTTNNTNGNATGSIVFVNDRIYALDTNNGVLALEFTTDPIEPGELYWTNANAIRTAEIDGGNPRTVLGGLVRAIGIDIDSARRHIYYADDQGGVIGRINLDGTNHQIIHNGRTNPQYLKIHDDRIYWAEYFDGLVSSNLDGSDVQELIVLPDSQSTTVTVAGDGTVYLGTANGSLYSPSEDPNDPNTWAIGNLDPGAYGIALDTETDTLYATSITDHSIYSMPFPGQDKTYVHSAWEPNQPLGIDLSRDRTEIFWVERANGRVRKGAIDGSSHTTLLTEENSPFGIIVVPELGELGTFDQWIAQFDLPADQRGPQDDPDGDGIANLMEYALAGGNPATADRDSLPVIGFETEGDDDYLLLAVEKNSDASGVSYVVEVTSELDATWNAGPGHTTVIEETDSLLIVRDNTPISAADRRFIRLRAELE